MIWIQLYIQYSSGENLNHLFVNDIFIHLFNELLILTIL